MDDAEDLEAELQRQLQDVAIDDDEEDEEDENDGDRPVYERKSLDELLASLQDEMHGTSASPMWTAFAEATRAADVALLSAVETDLADLDLYDVRSAIEVDPRSVATTPNDMPLPPTPTPNVTLASNGAAAPVPEEASLATEDEASVSYCHAHCEPSCDAVCLAHCALVMCSYYSSSAAAAAARHAASMAEDEVFWSLSQQSVQAIAIAARVPTVLTESPSDALPANNVDAAAVIGSPTKLDHEARCEAIERKHRERVAAMEAERAAADAAYEAQQRELEREISFLLPALPYVIAAETRRLAKQRRDEARQRAEDALRAEQAAHDRRLADEARRLDEEHQAFREDRRSRAIHIAIARNERLAIEGARATNERSLMGAEDAASMALAQALVAVAAWMRNVDRSRTEERAMAAAEAIERAREAAVAEADRIARERERREALRRERLEEEARREAAIQAVLAQEAAARAALKKQALEKEAAERRLLAQREEDCRRKRLADEQRQRTALERVEAVRREAQARDAAEKERQREAQMREEERQRQDERARRQREAARRQETFEQACMERTDREAQAREAADRDDAARLAHYRRDTHASVLRDLVVWAQVREHEVRQRHLSSYLLALEDRRSFLLRKRSRVDAYAGAILGVAHVSRARWWRVWVREYGMHIERRAAICLQRAWRRWQHFRRHAAARVQSAFRGFHLRRKLASALELAKFVDDDDFDYDQVDVDAFLGPVDDFDLDEEPPPRPRVGWEATPETESDQGTSVALPDAAPTAYPVIDNQRRDDEGEDQAVVAPLPLPAPPESTASKLYQRMQKAVKMHRPKLARNPPPKKAQVDDVSQSVTWSTSGKKAKKVNVPSLVERLRRTTAASR
ncbi:hypothetical protein SDRG_10240 [Saprolegnia diclina VS20]|uniref:Uncharacterized protein n=1 Tax=Saprolegnia diclina (strain VS20) TaxID=1156394 RepID=T0RPX4_SAPDV|nr:hypothetical protein SDRG_10240 [Saprolegnia diclina VS20]EQC32042.1 hypothetical protein SDRG_10240 [Saprolegnia diclina VS20]|eukprot:XP_008614444.1 hypothetical protein SDRG_10240 [Saprolegnia diclina VS20]